jgi:predicted helicase
VDELVEWTRGLEKVTVYTTYASLGLGTLERAHAGGLAAWDLIVVDEAHRVSGRIGKPWAVVHDNQKIPSLRRLYMTATPRLWQLGDEDEAGAPGELVASMEDDPEGPFGSRAFPLTLSEAIDRAMCAPPSRSYAWTSPTHSSRPRSSWAPKAGRQRSAGTGSPPCRPPW